MSTTLGQHCATTRPLSSIGCTRWRIWEELCLNVWPMSTTSGQHCASTRPLSSIGCTRWRILSRIIVAECVDQRLPHWARIAPPFKNCLTLAEIDGGYEINYALYIFHIGPEFHIGPWFNNWQETRSVDLVLVQCWPTVCDAGPILNQHWLNTWRVLSCLLLAVLDGGDEKTALS